MNTAQKFRVDRLTVPPRVYLTCSNCDADLREILPTESVKVTRAYYCDKCSDGAIHLNTEKEGRKANG